MNGSLKSKIFDISKRNTIGRKWTIVQQMGQSEEKVEKVKSYVIMQMQAVVQEGVRQFLEVWVQILTLVKTTHLIVCGFSYNNC